MLYASYDQFMNHEEMAKLCPDAEVVSTGWLSCFAFVFNEEADIVPSEDDSMVPIVIWNISSSDLKKLDNEYKYPEYFDRRTYAVTDNEGNVGEAFVYVMQDINKGIFHPTRKYFDTLVKGCIENDIDVMYMYDALDDSYEYENGE